MQSTLYATIGGRNWPLQTWQQASDAYLSLIRRIGCVSRAPQCKIVNGDGDVVAYVAVTGVVWSPDHQEPLYNPTV